MTDGRLFFALWPDEEVQAELAALCQQLSPESGHPHHPQDLHMTLVFLGQVAQEQRVCIEKIADRIELSPFSVSVEQIELWRKPRLLCATASQMPDPLAKLVSSLQTGLAKCGFKPEARPYRPHVTLIRKVRKYNPFKLPQPIHWPVSRFVLATSGAGPGLPRYRVLKKWPADS